MSVEMALDNLMWGTGDFVVVYQVGKYTEKVKYLHFSNARNLISE